MLIANPALPWSSTMVKCSMALPYGSHLRASNKPPSPRPPNSCSTSKYPTKWQSRWLFFAPSSLKHLAKLKLAFLFLFSFFFFAPSRTSCELFRHGHAGESLPRPPQKKTPRRLSGSIACGFLCHLRNWKRNSWCAVVSSCHPPVSLIM